MKNRQSHKFTNSQMINATALFFSLFFLASAVAAALYTGEFGSVFYDWYLIMISPCPLVTDYLSIGGLGSAMLNAGACGMVCTVFMLVLRGESHANTLAGFFFGCGTLLLWAEFFKYVALFSGSLYLPASEKVRL